MKSVGFFWNPLIVNEILWVAMGSKPFQWNQMNLFDRSTKLLLLDLKSNLIKQLGSKSFESNFNLNELYLNNNDLIEIEENSFYGLNKLETLNLSNNSISIINQNGFNNSSIKTIIISIHNLTNDTFCNLKYSLESKLIRNFTNYNYYDTIYLENRVDLFNCANIITFMRDKIFYNLRNDYDIDRFILECNNLTKYELINSDFNCFDVKL